MKNENENPIVKRIAVKATCVFTSPALIGSGFGENTDNDILRDKYGKAFLPGSTVAGVLRALPLDTERLFGRQEADQNNISPLWVFDAELTDGDKPAKVVELDGVAIDRENKVALDAKKYDYEAVETGTQFTLRFLLTIREKDGDYETQLRKVIGALKSGVVAFGSKTRRGFGAVQCDRVVKREFTLTPGNTAALDEWLDFDWDMDSQNLVSWMNAESEMLSTDTTTITAKLKLGGSIMIRDTRNIYEDLTEREDAPDYRHISSGGHPVILGTSWAGAFRSGLYRLLKMKYPDQAERYIDSVFGYVYEPKKGGEAATEPSKIVFGVSFLNAKDERVDGYRRMTRVKIDRFTGGAADGALFTEEPWYGGDTTLEIRYPTEYEDIRELILLGLDAMDKGILQIGGEGSVGRGFFNVEEVTDPSGPVSVEGSKPILKATLEGIKRVGETA